MSRRQREAYASGVWREGSAAGISSLCEIRGSQESQRGVCQLRSPRSVITDGSRIMRTTVASSRTATPRPTPICCMSCMDSVPKTAKTATMITAAPVTAPAVRVMPSRIAARLSRPRSRDSRMRETTNTW